MTDTLTCAIVGHLVGDYLLQNDWMANNKKQNWWICGLHCAIWSVCVGLLTGWIFLNVVDACFVMVILFVTHFIQDATGLVPWWMQKIGQRRFMQSDRLDMPTYNIIPGLGPWSIIVVDNVWHIFTIWAIWRFIV